MAKRVEVRREHHGDVFLDPYEWLRDKSDPEVIAYLEAENAYVEQRTAGLAPLRQRIFDEIKGRTKETDLSVPTRRGDWWYSGRSIEGKQYVVQCRCPVVDPDDWTPPELEAHAEIDGEQVVLDENVEAEGQEFFSVGAATVSPDGTMLAYSVDVTGDERYTLKFRDIRSGAMLEDVVDGIGDDVVWAADDRTVYYVTVDDAWRPDTVWRHRIGAGVPDDVVYREADERFWVSVNRSRSDKYVFIGSASAVTGEVYVGDAADPGTTFASILPRRENVQYSVDHAVVGGDDRFLVLHNDGAENFTLVDAPVDDPTAFRTLIPPRDDVRLEAVDAFAEHVVVSYRSDALPRLQLWPIRPDGSYAPPEDIAFDTELTTCSLSLNPNWSAPRIRVGTTSFVVPVRIYDIELATRNRILLREQPVLGGYRPEDYVERRDWAVAADGARIPISIIHRAGLPLPAPAVLYGYGAYETCEDPYFSFARLSLVDRGMVFVIAHVRGGGELGRSWYEHGKLLEKKNTFTDFVAVARHLVSTDVTRAEHMVAYGGSAGGLLMGAVANMAPELFTGVLAEVPFVDALTTMLDPSLPLTVTEWDEWGNPLDDERVYRYMKSYTPYENVEARDYPSILAVTSLNDTRVFYVEPAKWVAALRYASPDSQVLLKTEMVAGHGGASGRYDRWRETAFQYAWVLATADPERYGAD